MFEHNYTLLKLHLARHEDMLRRLEQQKLARIAREESQSVCEEDVRFHLPVGFLYQEILRTLVRGIKIRTRQFSRAKQASDVL
jgi:hypothetical protein